MRRSVLGGDELQSVDRPHTAWRAELTEQPRQHLDHPAGPDPTRDIDRETLARPPSATILVLDCLQPPYLTELSAVQKPSLFVAIL
jgi:hypothetical protein